MSLFKPTVFCLPTGFPSVGFKETTKFNASHVPRCLLSAKLSSRNTWKRWNKPTTKHETQKSTCSLKQLT